MKGEELGNSKTARESELDLGTIMKRGEVYI